MVQQERGGGGKEKSLQGRTQIKKNIGGRTNFPKNKHPPRKGVVENRSPRYVWGWGLKKKEMFRGGQKNNERRILWGGESLGEEHAEITGGGERQGRVKRGRVIFGHKKKNKR